MTTTEIMHKDLIAYIDSLVKECREEVSSAIREMEKFHISPIDFRKEAFKLNLAAFTLGYLDRIKEVSQKYNYKTTGLYILFIKHQIETKASNELDLLKSARKPIIAVLSHIIDLYFD